jgi:hypothetical protein
MSSLLKCLMTTSTLLFFSVDFSISRACYYLRFLNSSSTLLKRRRASSFMLTIYIDKFFLIWLDLRKIGRQNLSLKSKLTRQLNSPCLALSRDISKRLDSLSCFIQIRLNFSTMCKNMTPVVP